MARLCVAFLALATLVAQNPVEFVCPMDPEIRSKTPGKCSKCGMKLEPGIPQPVEYPLSLKADPPRIPSGQPVRLEFRLSDPKTGAPVKKFEVVHEKLFHLFIVSNDLEYFAHEHPGLGKDSVFRLETTLPKPGIYRLLADVFPMGGTPQLIPKTLTTAGYTKTFESSMATLRADLAPKRSANMEVELAMEPPQPIAGKKTLMFFRMQPSEGLEPYLGAWSHMLAVSNDLIDMIHTHPAIADGGPRLQFDVFFPREATYRIWVQFQRLGKVNTVQFTVPVSRLK